MPQHWFYSRSQRLRLLPLAAFRSTPGHLFADDTPSCFHCRRHRMAGGESAIWRKSPMCLWKNGCSARIEIVYSVPIGLSPARERKLGACCISENRDGGGLGRSGRLLVNGYGVKLNGPQYLRRTNAGPEPMTQCIIFLWSKMRLRDENRAALDCKHIQAENPDTNTATRRNSIALQSCNQTPLSSIAGEEEESSRRTMILTYLQCKSTAVPLFLCLRCLFAADSFP